MDKGLMENRTVFNVSALLLCPALLFAQLENHTVRVIPDSTRANVGTLEFLDKQTTPHKTNLQGSRNSCR